MCLTRQRLKGLSGCSAAIKNPVSTTGTLICPVSTGSTRGKNIPETPKRISGLFRFPASFFQAFHHQPYFNTLSTTVRWKHEPNTKCFSVSVKKKKKGHKFSGNVSGNGAKQPRVCLLVLPFDLLISLIRSSKPDEVTSGGDQWSVLTRGAS